MMIAIARTAWLCGEWGLGRFCALMRSGWRLADILKERVRPLYKSTMHCSWTPPFLLVGVLKDHAQAWWPHCSDASHSIFACCCRCRRRMPSRWWRLVSQPWRRQIIPSQVSHCLFLRLQVSEEDAQKMVEAGVKIVAEGANMPSDPEAIKVYHEKGIEFGPAKVQQHLIQLFSGPC